MQIKKIALAALVAVAAAPAFAFIDGAGVPMGQAELVFMAYNENGSFVKDLGITTDAFLAQVNATGTFNMSVLGSEYSRFTALGGNTVWAVGAANPIEFGFNPGEVNYYGTKGVNQSTFNVTNQLFNDGVNTMSNFFGITESFANNAGIGFDAGVNNIEWTAKKAEGTPDYEPTAIHLQNNYVTTNQIGTAAEMVYLTSSNGNGSALVVGGAMGNQALRINFDGANITAISPVAVVPEPSTYAMLLAGLCAVGFVARRRQA